MARYRWIRDLFHVRRHVDRKTPARSRPALETLEDRTTPALTGIDLSAPEAFVEDTPLELVDIDIDSDSVNVTATLTLSDPAAGSLSTDTSDANGDGIVVTSTYDPATGVWTAEGLVDDVEALLAGVRFTPSPDYNADFSIATSITDDSGATITGVKLVDGTPVNDQPTADDQSITTDEDTAFQGMLAGDDADPEATQALTFAIVLLPSHGSLTLDPATGAFTYTPADDYNGPDSFTFTVTDDDTAGGPALTSTAATGTVTVNAVNDAPVLTVPGQQTTPEDIAVTITGLSVSDVDVNEGTGEIKITLSVASGTLSVGTAVAGGLSAGQISGSGTSTVELQGSIDAVNATLAAGVTYLGNLNFNGDDTLTVQADDLGNTGDGGPQTAEETVPIHVLSPAEQVAALRDQVEALADDGAFKNKGRLNSLLTKLRQMDAALEKDHGKVAFNVAGAFINQVRAFRKARILTAAQADPLLDAATQLRTSLSIGDFEVTEPGTVVAAASSVPSTPAANNPGNGQGTIPGQTHPAAHGLSTAAAHVPAAASVPESVPAPDTVPVPDDFPGQGNGKQNGNSQGKGKDR